ncbi:histone-like nucleoid-structuring protein Lsr2 [Promicromonospora aerolata]|uniref:Lsr2 family protein n=1 Tax=Promicromonospora aerolata TaxID=195749 RepID=A0ABW4V3H0_9MICO
MAIKTIVESDISGQSDAATVTFGLGNTWFEVDLTEDEQKELEQALAPFVKAGRKAGQSTKKKRATPETTVEERAKIRAWAREQGHEVTEFGRIPRKIIDAYREAHKKSDQT